MVPLVAELSKLPSTIISARVTILHLTDGFEIICC